MLGLVGDARADAREAAGPGGEPVRPRGGSIGDVLMWRGWMPAPAEARPH